LYQNYIYNLSNRIIEESSRRQNGLGVVVSEVLGYEAYVADVDFAIWHAGCRASKVTVCRCRRHGFSEVFGHQTYVSYVSAREKRKTLQRTLEEEELHSSNRQASVWSRVVN